MYYGGLFILRQVNSLTTFSGTVGKDGIDALGAGDTAKEAVKTLKETQFAFSAYSPGVMFLLGGVFIMTITQYLAIEVQTIDVFPKDIANAYCTNKDTGRLVLCESEAIQGGITNDRPKAAASSGASNPYEKE